MIVDPRFTKEVSAFVKAFNEVEIPVSLSGTEVSFTLCNRLSKSSKLGNYFISLNLPFEEDAFSKLDSLSLFYPELQQLNVDDIVVIKIPPSAYSEFIDARSIELNIPVTGYTTSILKAFSSTYSGGLKANKEGETNPLLGDNITFLFCDSVNLPYTGLTMNEMGQITSHENVVSWNPITGNYKDRPAAVSYESVKQSNETINTDRRYRINKSVFIDGLYQDQRGIALGYYDTAYSNSISSPFGNKVSLVTMPGQNYFQVGDPITVDEFDHKLNPTYSGNTTVLDIVENVPIPGLKYAPKSYNNIYDCIVTDITWGSVSQDEAGIVYTSGGTYYNYDIPVGFAVLDKGLIVLTHRDIVKNIHWSSGTDQFGNSPPTGLGKNDLVSIYFRSTGTTIYGNQEPSNQLKFTDLNTVFSMKSTCNAMLGEFYLSSNPTWQKNTVNNPLAADDPVKITEIGLYNQMNELIAVAKLSEPISKSAFDLMTFEIDINM